jgi:hypothetical protein
LRAGLGVTAAVTEGEKMGVGAVRVAGDCVKTVSVVAVELAVSVGEEAPLKGFAGGGGICMCISGSLCECECSGPE